MKHIVSFVFFWISIHSGAIALAAEGREVPIASYLRELAEQHNVEISGLEIVGRDTFTPPVTVKSVDKALRRALARYNTIEHYGEQGVVRVVILGRRGESVGVLPDDQVIETPQEQNPES